MRAEQIDKVIDTWKKLERRRDDLGALFYSKLFAREPSLRAMFQNDIAVQASLLGNTLSFAVTNLRRSDALLPVVRQLGRTHALRGVGEKHYALAASPLLDALGEMLGPDWDAAAEAAWAAFYAMIVDEMTAVELPVS